MAGLVLKKLLELPQTSVSGVTLNGMTWCGMVSMARSMLVMQLHTWGCGLVYPTELAVI